MNSHSNRGSLIAALVAAVLATTIIAVVAVIRTGPADWLVSLGRVLVMALLSILVLRGKSWARWVLAVVYSFAALVFFGKLLRVSAEPVALTVFLAMAGLYIWAIVELAKTEWDAAA